MKRDKDSKSQLERLGTNEIQIGSQAGFEKKFDRWRSRVESFERLDQSQLGPANSSSKHQFENPSQYMKFSTILHLDSYHRDITVNKLIDARDARRKVERMSNKRKVVEYAEDKDETRNEPLSKIFKPSELNDLTSLKDSDEVETVNDGVAEGTEGVSGATTAPKSSPTVGPQAEISDKVQSIPKLEPKKEPNELETAFKNIPEGYKYNVCKVTKQEANGNGDNSRNLVSSSCKSILNILTTGEMETPLIKDHFELLKRWQIEDSDKKFVGGQAYIAKLKNQARKTGLIKRRWSERLNALKKCYIVTKSENILPFQLTVPYR